MKKLEQHIKKQRNDTDTQVKKYKQELDVIGIQYSNKHADVQVPNSATGGFECFKWDWITSTTGSHSAIVQIFKDIVRTLKEAKSNPAQYNSLVSNLSASAKSALEATIQANNITVPTQDSTKLISEILVGMQTWLDTKSHIPTELKNKFVDLGFKNLNIFIEASYKQFNNKLVVKEFIDNAVKTGEEGRKYLADCGYSSPDQLWANYIEPKIANLITEQHSTKLTSDILEGIQIWIDTKSHIPIELKNKFLKLGFSNLEKFIEDGFNKFHNIYTIKEFIENAFIPPREEINEYLIDSGSKSVEEFIKKYVEPKLNVLDVKEEDTQKSITNVNHGNQTSEEDSDDDIEVISKLLDEKVTLNNGKKVEVKKFIELLDKENTRELVYNFKQLNSTDSSLVAKEMALKLAHDLLHSKKAFDIVDSTAQVIGKVIPEFEKIYEQYQLCTDDQLHEKETEISGVSHLDGCDYHG